MEKFVVYMHINRINDKKYIGITCQEPERRWREDGFGYKTSQHFYNAIQKYGWDNFDNVILARGLSKEEAEREEIRLIKLYDTTNDDKGYNLSNGGSVAGKHSKRTRALMSKKAKSRKVDLKRMKKMWEANRSREYTKEHRENISKALNGKKLSDYHVERIRWSHIGYKHTEEVKRKIAKSVKRTKSTPEHRELVSKKMKDIYKENPDLIKGMIESNKKRVICITTGEVFDQMKDGAKKYGLKSASGITEACQGKRKYSGKLPDGTKLKWAYYEGHQASD